MGLQAVDRACAFLFMLRRLTEASLTELSEASGIMKSTARGVLASLVENGLVCQDPVTRRYRLGTGLIHLAQESGPPTICVWLPVYGSNRKAAKNHRRWSLSEPGENHRRTHRRAAKKELARKLTLKGPARNPTG